MRWSIDRSFGTSALGAFRLIGFALLCVVPCVALQSQERAPVLSYRSRILGVFDEATGDPVAGVQVLDLRRGTSALTTSTGTVSLGFLPDGGGLVRIRKVGYETQTVAASISPADTSPITIVLRRMTTLPAVITRDSAPHHQSSLLQAFEDRRAQGAGYFVTDSLLQAHEVEQLREVIAAHFPGLWFPVLRSGIARAASSRGAGGPCFVSVYTDGALSPADFNKLQAQDFSAAEFYPGELWVPAEFTPNPCGVLLLWTKEP